MSRATIAIRLLAPPALALATACAPAPAQRPASRDPNILRADEIAAAGVPTAYDALMRLRPRFLMGRGPSGLDANGAVRIYVDGVYQSRPDDLRAVPAADVVYIRYLSATEATLRYGTGFDRPLVYVLTRAMAGGPPR